MTDTQKYDLLVIGATPAGIACAIRAARAGLRVLLTSHLHYIGGMLSNGLGNWDSLYEGRRAPLVDEFIDRMKAYYRSTYGPTSEPYRVYRRNLSPEPHVAEKVFNDMVAAEATLSVLKNHYPSAVERAENLIRAVILKAMGGDERRRVEARAFADATYEGDLLAVAGVPYRVGREARRQYDEPHAGRIFTQFFYGHFPREAVEGRLNLRPFNLNSREVFAGSSGEGDRAIQAYNFRSILSRDPDNRRYPQKPENYDRSTYLILLQEEPASAAERYPFRSTWLLQDIRQFRFQNWKPLPNNKLSWNHGNYVGQNYDYPTGDWDARREISRRHRDFELGLLYFLQNDQAVPAEVRQRAREWGLALDEFTDNDNFPYELYIREARRMIGRYVFTEHDASLAPGLQRAPIHADSIAISEWPMDSHECRTERQLGSAGEGMVLLNEKTRPAQIPYRSLLPERLDNLLAPGCLSATHIGWGTVRVEPCWMHIGEAAGFAAALAQQKGTTPANVSISQLQQRLVENGVMLSFFNDFDMQTDRPWVAAVQYLGTQGFFHSYDARPEAPLTRTLAREWARTFGALLAGDIDPNQRARVCTGLAADETGLTATQFANLLARELDYRDCDPAAPAQTLGQLALEPEAQLSRGDACRIIYALIFTADEAKI